MRLGYLCSVLYIQFLQNIPVNLPFFFPESSCAWKSCLAIGHSAFYYTNYSNISSHSVQISHNTCANTQRRCYLKNKMGFNALSVPLCCQNSQKAKAFNLYKSKSNKN